MLVQGPAMATDVFLSSTAKDLAAYRDAVFDSLARSPFYKCVRHENVGPQSADAVTACERMVRGSAIFVGLIGLRRGWEPPGDNLARSITEMEYDWATAAGTPRYLWLVPDGAEVAGNEREAEPLQQRQRAFRHRLRSEIVVDEARFAAPEAFGSRVLNHLLTQDLAALLVDRPGPDRLAMPGDAARGPIASAFARLAHDDDVDLADLVADPGRVNVEELSGKLMARAERAEQLAHARRAEADASLRESAVYWRHIGSLSFLGATDTAIAAYQRAVELDPDEPDGWQYLGELRFRAGDRHAAADAFDALRRIGDRAGDDRTRAMGNLRLAWIADARGDFADAERLACVALDLAQAGEWQLGIVRTRGYLGMLYRMWNRFADAEEMCNAALQIATGIGARAEQCIILGNLGAIHQAREDYLGAIELYGQAISLNESLGRIQGVAIQKGRLGDVYLALGKPERALDAHRQAMALYGSLSDKEGIADQNEKLARVHLHNGDHSDARQRLQEARCLFTELGMAARVENIDRLLADVGNA